MNSSAKLTTIKVKGIYKTKDGLLPDHMAKLTPDAAEALAKVQAEIEARGGCFRLSDCYRSSEMQRRAHEDYKAGRKRAYSPPAGNSMHEAGRAIDLDLAALIHPQSVPKGGQVFREQDIRAIFEKHGWTFITSDVGNPHRVDTSEAWHIEFRGKFQDIYDQSMRVWSRSKLAYQSMVKEAIADLSR